MKSATLLWLTLTSNEDWESPCEETACSASLKDELPVAVNPEYPAKVESLLILVSS